MERLRKTLTLLLASTMLMPSGCSWNQHNSKFDSCVPKGTYETVASEIDYPSESACTQMNADDSLGSPAPWTLQTQGTPQYWDMSLEEAIQITLSNSRVLRDLGGAVVRSPATTRTTFDVASVETDPRTGVEAALSAFDAQFLTSTFWEKNHRALNNQFFGGGTRLLFQDAGVFQAAIAKKSVSGTQFSVRHNVDYDANNAPGNLFPSAWNTNVEAEIRHPLLQGGGVEFNRIAGPGNQAGVYTGVLLARLNTDVALTDFEIAVRDLVSNVESAYWDLYYGYRVLDAKVKARDAGLETWRKIYALNEVNRRGGEAEKEAQARSQYYTFQQDVQNALSGEPIDATRNWNGLPSGSFRGTGGVLMAERRLRLLMGIAPTDNKLIRPIDEPIAAKIDFDWAQITAEASTRRAELRRQKWIVRRRELELIASKNFLLPKLDAVGRYRWRGFGDDLFPTSPPLAPPNERFDNAYGNLTSGEFQEWQLGFELSVPIGFREGHVAARNAELLLSRERAVLRDQQREVIHEVADAVAEVDRAYTVLQTSFNRLGANRDQLGAVQAAYEADKAPLDLFLDAQRRVADAEVDYYLNRSRYTLATKNVHFVKGTLLDYDGVQLAEGPWPGEAYVDAAKREASRGAPKPLNYASSRAPIVGQGAFDQRPGIGCPADASSPKEETPEHTPTVLPVEAAQSKTKSTKGEAAAARDEAKPTTKPTLKQPEVIQAASIEPMHAQQKPAVSSASNLEPATQPKIALRPDATPETTPPQTPTPAAPRRLPTPDK